MGFWNKPRNYLELEAELDAEYLHAGGEGATEFLLTLLRGSSVLEIGCGTGATLRRLGPVCPLVVGIDLSAKMLSRARSKSSAFLVRAEAGAIPFRSDSFDLVVAESVAGILDLATILGEWVRPLKPGGVLALNDGLWKPEVSQAEAERINKECMKLFGHRIAPPGRQTVRDWREILSSQGLVDIRMYPVKGDSVLGRDRAARLRRRRAKLLRPRSWPVLFHFRRQWLDLGPFLEYWIMVARKPTI